MKTILIEDVKNEDRFLVGGREFRVLMRKFVAGKHHQNDHIEFFGQDVESKQGATFSFALGTKFRIKDTINKMEF